MRGNGGSWWGKVSRFGMEGTEEWDGMGWIGWDGTLG